jgi:hypothetical protein
MNDYVVNISPNHALIKPISKSEVSKNSFADIEFVDGENFTRLNKDDSFVTLNKNEDYFFQHFGFVAEKPRTEQLSENEARNLLSNFEEGFSYYRHIVPVKIKDVLTKDNLLDEYMYSLLGIKNLANPYIHFRKKVTALNPNDYETITKQWVYVARTIFARLINAIPKENRLDFVLQSMAQFQKIELRETPFLRAIEFLRDYIDENFLSQGRLLIGIKHILENELNEVGIPINELSFLDHEEENNQLNDSNPFVENNDKIIQQAKSFEQLFSIDEDLGIIDKIFNDVSKNVEIERRFEKLFKNKPWPIDLRI